MDVCFSPEVVACSEPQLNLRTYVHSWMFTESVSQLQCLILNIVGWEHLWDNILLRLMYLFMYMFSRSSLCGLLQPRSEPPLNRCAYSFVDVN